MERFFQRLVSMHPLALITGLCMMVLTIPTYRLLDAERANVGAIPKAVNSQGDAVRVALTKEIHDLRTALVGDPNTPKPLTEQALALIDSHAKNIEGIASTAISTQVGRLNDSVASVATSVANLQADLKPALAAVAPAVQQASGGITTSLSHVDSLTAEATKTMADLHPQTLGLVAAAKVTAGEAATTLRLFQRATPELLTEVQDAVSHIDAASAASAEASQNAAKVTANLAAATKPLPRSVRIGLQVAGPLSQIASYVILMLSTLGVL